jgi:DNA-directed RNA polymerase alpha subunit
MAQKIIRKIMRECNISKEYQRQIAAPRKGSINGLVNELRYRKMDFAEKKAFSELCNQIILELKTIDKKRELLGLRASVLRECESLLARDPLEISIEQLCLSTRLSTRLRKNGYSTVKDILDKKSGEFFLSLSGLGIKSIDELKKTLRQLNLKFSKV